MPGLRDEDKVDPGEALLEAQMELSILQRQYRCMRNDKRTYTEETENAVRKQKMVIEALVKDNKELEAMSQVAKSRQNELLDQENVKKIAELLDREVQVQEEIKEEKEAVARVEEEVAAMSKAINQQCKKMKGSKDIDHQKHIANIKLTRVLENRLDNMTKKFSIALTDNSNLRGYINHIEGQKARFLDLYRRLKSELSEGKKQIDRISEMATAHFHVRDEAQHRMASLRERAERDLAMYKSDIKDVMRVLEHDRKLCEFMTAKSEDRVSILEEEMISRMVKKLETQLSGLRQEANKFEDIFDKIKEATGIEDTDTLVKSFIQNEDQNFALFNYVNNLNTEIETLQDEIRYLKDEIEMIKREGVENDVRRKVILTELEAKMNNATDELTIVKKECKISRRQLELLKPKIEKVFNSIRCDRASITELLGGGVTVDDNNIIQYLGIIEQKCNQLLQTKALLRVKLSMEEGGEIPIEGLQGVGPHPAHDNISIVPPPIEEEGDQWYSNDAKPLTVDEIQALVLQGSVRAASVKGAGAAKYPVKRKRA